MGLLMEASPEQCGGSGYQAPISCWTISPHWVPYFLVPGSDPNVIFIPDSIQLVESVFHLEGDPSEKDRHPLNHTTGSLMVALSNQPGGFWVFVSASREQ